jgi:hypothetical protein
MRHVVWHASEGDSGSKAEMSTQDQTDGVQISLAYRDPLSMPCAVK